MTMQTFRWVSGMTLATQPPGKLQKPLIVPEIMRNAEYALSAKLHTAITYTHASEAILAQMSAAYAAGVVEPYEIARLLGPQWTVADVVVALEEYGSVRGLELDASDAYEDVQDWLRDLRLNDRADSVSSRARIKREVIASQRIEGIDARDHFS